MPGNERDLLDDYLEAGKVSVSPLTSGYIYEHSGHRLMCPKCKEFRRTKIDIVAEPPKSYLRVVCKTCGATRDFEIRKPGIVPRWWSEKIRGWAFFRAKQIMREAVKDGPR